ncbi:DUF4397 domain-containing protein [Clostridium botulinum]|uniref:DUF4397 domain-containing protein n=1 Tax=Clostridium botulinum (strain Kyoto / Type A2) TaxID=536232 RepID=C1FTD4_CLOBJ|nr:DUF4397 domain-containing protein [Clostridium botulinum]ACO86502.1 conserved hypothetical protein [Clostridium botulinum A2 str. Kyoto]APH23207.1 hypothetical protein NPD1_4051 [Clostridium botulinum]APQ69298.1 hypothetical protein RSJ8_2178 [Clostridium botulinum]APQ76746.1 hypothetical protein RSJ10_2686 [Clostridium botulinum]AUM99855.1 hypothetical protein RSJ13_12920 [Clostridium botulinum]
MFNLPCFNENKVKFRKSDEKSHIRILHASPDAPAVDIYINDNLIYKGLSYKSFTEYMPLISMVYNIKVFPTGKKDVPLINKFFFIPPNSIYTIAATNFLKNIALFPILDKKLDNKNPNKAYVRFVHLSPNAPKLDFYMNGKKIFNSIGYKNITNYSAVDPKNYTLNLKISNTENTILTSPNANLKADKYYTVYAVGLANGKPSLQVLIPLDGNSYIR